MSSTLEQARRRYHTLTSRYNREYHEGKWTTNRTLAGHCENAYDALTRALTEAGIPEELRHVYFNTEV